jgi:excisionase family DNA binding protein
LNSDEAVSWLLAVPEAAKRAGVTGQTIRAWIHTGLLPATKVGRDWLISAEDLDRKIGRVP